MIKYSPRFRTLTTKVSKDFTKITMRCKYRNAIWGRLTSGQIRPKPDMGSIKFALKVPISQFPNPGTILLQVFDSSK
jgi:hypothetical protein